VRRPVLACCGVLAALVVWLALPPGASAGDPDGATALLERSRVATARHEFDGTMVVRWRSGGRMHQKDVDVRSADGVLHVGNNRVLGAGARRVLKTGSGWALLWSDPPQSDAPDPTDKYRFRVAEGPVVAGRPTTAVVVARTDGSGARERLSFDLDSGLLLRRDQVSDGRLVRRVAFTSIERLQRTDRAGRRDLSRIGAKAVSQSPSRLRDAPEDLRVYKRVGDGFALRGMYERPEGGTQLYYSDGLFGLSLFEEAGQLAWSELPDGGQTVSLGGVDARVYRTPVGVTAVWEDEDITFTCITDAPLGEVTAIIDDLHRRHEPSTLEEVGRFVTGPFNWG
jgi:hypothetical protein